MTGNEVTNLDLAELIAGLERAEGNTDPRDSVGEALMSVHRFLKGIPSITTRDLDAPILALILALGDLRNSTVAPILEGAGSPNRHPTTAARRIMKAYCSFMVDCLLAAGHPLERSCRIVAGALTDSKILKGQNGQKWERIRNWRSDAKKLALDQQERMVLDALREEIGTEKFTAADAIARIRRLDTKIGRFG